MSNPQSERRFPHYGVASWITKRKLAEQTGTLLFLPTLSWPGIISGVYYEASSSDGEIREMHYEVMGSAVVTITMCKREVRSFSNAQHI